MTTDITAAIRHQVPSVPKAIAMLAVMERELSKASTYEQIRRVIKEASALKVLLGEVDEVRTKANDTILVAYWYIGDELNRVPKASGGNQKANLPSGGNSKGKEATGIKHSARARYSKLATVPLAKVKATSTAIKKRGKEVSLKAVVDEIAYGDKKTRRAARVEKMVVKALPKALHNVGVADPPWRTETWSDRGMDRSADNHYPTMSLDEIKALDVPSIMAKDALFGMWVTGPHLKQGMEVLEAWGFEYKAVLTWDKEVAGTGKWFTNQTEHFLLGTRGNVPAPVEDQLIPSLLRERKTKHSAKPEAILEWLDGLYPGALKVELFRRGPARHGWAAWGNEAEDEAA